MLLADAALKRRSSTVADASEFVDSGLEGVSLQVCNNPWLDEHGWIGMVG
jgi:hypothetical protein